MIYEFWPTQACTIPNRTKLDYKKMHSVVTTITMPASYFLLQNFFLLQNPFLLFYFWPLPLISRTEDWSSNFNQSLCLCLLHYTIVAVMPSKITAIVIEQISPIEVAGLAEQKANNLVTLNPTS